MRDEFARWAAEYPSAVAQGDVRHRERDDAAARHCVTRIDRDVDQRKFELRDVHFDRPDIRRDVALEPNVAASAADQKCSRRVRLNHELDTYRSGERVEGPKGGSDAIAQSICIGMLQYAADKGRNANDRSPNAADATLIRTTAANIGVRAIPSRRGQNSMVQAGGIEMEAMPCR